ncbi:MAG: hypothetical protein WC227_02425 [Patescibacteria group bacterium]|jgi:hypothetical protein
MKKVLKIVSIAIGAMIIISALMFATDTCPPKGPWPTPPWCSASPARNSYSVSTNAVKLSQTKAVSMSDTWGRNYNMGMFETTQKNISSSFDRVAELGAKEVYVNDFHLAKFGKGSDFTTTDYEIVGDTFWNDFRDEEISTKDLKKLADGAHSRGLKIGIKHNISFVDMRKYIKAGLSGDIQTGVVSDYEKFNTSHSEEWIKDYFAKWQTRLIERGSLYQSAGIDTMSISPTWMEPIFAGHEALANSLQNELIRNVREVFRGQIYAEVNRYGFMENINGKEDWTKYDFFTNADVIEIRVYDLPEKYRGLDAKTGIYRYLQDLNSKAGEKKVKLTIFFAPSSYTNSLNKGALEVLDSRSEGVINVSADYQYQNGAFEAFFASLAGLSNIERIDVANYPWDDSLDPEVKPKLSVACTFRNKPAEEIIKSWFNK